MRLGYRLHQGFLGMSCLGPGEKGSDRLIRIIEIDPFVNGRAKVLIDLEGLKQNLYIDPEYWIYYHLADHAVVVIREPHINSS